MTAYECVVIGINRYHFLKPLGDAERDAQAFYSFFSQETEKPVLLLTDTSPDIQGNSTYPNGDNILHWLRMIPCGNNSPLWFFFRGYGTHYQGKDYLIPIDGNPHDVLNLGISALELLTILQHQKPCLLIFDLNCCDVRTPIGQQIITLVKQMGIGLILSVHLGNEISSQGHSKFTTALLESLRYYGDEVTIRKLAQYLGDRLPQFASFSGLTLSSPIIISPSLAFSSQLLLTSSVKKSLQTVGVITAKEENLNLTLPKLPYINSEKVSQAQLYTLVEEEINSDLLLSESESKEPDNLNSSEIDSHSSSFRFFQIWIGLGVIFALVFCMILIQFVKPNLFNQTLSSIDIKAQRELLNQAQTYLKGNQASGFNKAISKVDKIPPNSPVYPEAQKSIAHWSQVILDIAQGRAKVGNFQDAIAAAKLIPPEQKQVYSIGIKSIEQWKIKAKQQQVNHALIDAAKALIKPNQASSYNQAITILRQVKLGEIGYLEAQKLINRWSEKIYLIAQSRAARGKFKLAIKTAELVPKNTPAYEKARKSLAKWKKKAKT